MAHFLFSSNANAYQRSCIKTYFDISQIQFFFDSSLHPQPTLDPAILAHLTDFHRHNLNPKLLTRTPPLSDLFIDYLASVSSYLTQYYPAGSYATNHPVTVFQNYYQHCLLPSIQRHEGPLPPQTSALIPFAFLYDNDALKNSVLTVFHYPTIIEGLLPNPHLADTLYDIAAYLSQNTKLSSTVYANFLSELSQQILDAPECHHTKLLYKIIALIKQAPSSKLLSSYSVNFLLVSLYTQSPLSDADLIDHAQCISPLYSFSQSISQILYLILIRTPPISHTSVLPTSFTKLISFIQKNGATDYFPPSEYTALTMQYAIHHGRTDVLCYLQERGMACFSKADLQALMRNNKTRAYSVDFFSNMKISPYELAVNILQYPQCDSGNVFLYLDHLHEVLSLLPNAHNNTYLLTAYSALITKLGPTFSEYYRLASRGNYSHSFMKIVENLLQKGAPCGNLPSFLPEVTAVYRRKHNPLSLASSSLLNQLLLKKFATFLAQTNPLHVFSPFAGGNLYRKNVRSHLSILQKLDPCLLKRHAFAIRCMLTWRILSFWSFLYSLFSPRYAAESLYTACTDNHIDLSCIRSLLSPAQQRHLKDIQHATPTPRSACTLRSVTSAPPSEPATLSKTLHYYHPIGCSHSS